MLIKRIFIGTVCVVLGLLLIKFREKVQKITGTVNYAEKIFGPGGTFTFYLLLGSITVILAILYMFGVLQRILPGLLGPIFG